MFVFVSVEGAGDAVSSKVSSTFTMINTIFGPSSSTRCAVNGDQSALRRTLFRALVVLVLAPAYFTAPLLIVTAALVLYLGDAGLAILLRLWLTLGWLDVVEVLVTTAWAAYAVLLAIPLCFACLFAYWALQDIRHLRQSNRR